MSALTQGEPDRVLFIRFAAPVVSFIKFEPNDTQGQQDSDISIENFTLYVTVEQKWVSKSSIGIEEIFYTIV
jgi:hypothetical protein